MINIDKLISEARSEQRTQDLEVLKMMKAEFLREQTSESRKIPTGQTRATTPLTGPEEQAVIRRMVKTRKASIDAYVSAGRPELATKEEAEVTFLTGFLEKEPSVDDVLETLGAWIASHPDLPVDFGPRMAAARKDLPGIPPRLLAEALKKIS